jgi:putative ABC transport system permease protein
MIAWARIRAVFRRRQLESELDEEMRSHIEFATEDYLRQGMTGDDARRLARVKFGSVEASKDAHRDARGLPLLDGLAYDLRFAVRSLVRDRRFSVTAIIMLALAIGLNAAVFGVVNTMLFRGFALVKHNSRLLYIQERYTLKGCCLLEADFDVWRRQSKSFENLALVGSRSITLRDGVVPARDLIATTLTTNSFALLGVLPILGRDFAPADEVAGAPPVVILTFHDWQARFGHRADIVGHVVVIDDAPATIIGVMPQGFDFPMHGQLWMPRQHLTEAASHRPSASFAFGSLADGVSKATARAELDVINQRLEKEFPASNKGVRALARTFSEFFIGPEARMIYGSLWAAALFVLLIACANMANLALARTLSRSRELSTRIALGAGRARMLRQVFSESVLVTTAAGGIGWWIARWSIYTWAEATRTRYLLLDYTTGPGILLYLIGLTIVVALILAAIPMAQTVRLELNGVLKGDSRGVTLNGSAKRLSALLVAGQMALAMILLAGTGVLSRSLWNILGADTGLKGAENVLLGRVSIPRAAYPASDERNAFWDSLLSDLALLPGVEAESLATAIPVGNPGARPVEVEDGQTVAETRPRVTTIAIGPGYLHAVGARQISGREFAATDRPDSPRVALVNQSFAAQYWPGQQAVGKRLRLDRDGARAESATVVGVISNIMQGRPLRDKFVPIVYLPFRQAPAFRAVVFVRTVGPANQMAGRVRSALESAAPGVEVEDYSTLQAAFAVNRDLMDLEHAELPKHAGVAPVFAGIALLLATVGLYAVVARSVRQRTREIGIRIALGATTDNIRYLVFAEAKLPVAVGLMAGIMGSFAVNRLLESQLVRVSPNDPVTLSSAPLILILAAILGCLFPLRQALLVDPVVALRHD